jgi:hypothetical protein
MKITIEPTDKIVTLPPNMTEARVWEGVSEAGVKCYLVIPRVAVKSSEDNSEFEKELRKTPQKPWDKSIDIRLII